MDMIPAEETFEVEQKRPQFPESIKQSARHQKKSSRACDACRKRKVRCDIDDYEAVSIGLRCSMCETQAIDCTFERIPLQRGPARGYKHKSKEKRDRDNPRKLHIDILAPGMMLPEIATPPIDTPSVYSSTGSTRHSALPTPMFVQRIGPGWIPHAINRWYLLYQHTLPMLEQDTMEFQIMLERVHPLLQAALLYAIYALVFKARTLERIDAILAEEALTRYSGEVRITGPDAMLDRLVYLQATMMLTVEADQRGYSVAASRTGHPVAWWLGASVGAAYSLRLHDPNSDQDLLESGHSPLGQRLWFILIVLDRWHAISTCTPPFIADVHAQIDAELPIVRSNSIYNHLYKLSLIVGHVYASFSHTSADQSRRAGDLIKLELEDWRTQVDVIWGQSNLLHIAFWHVSILAIADPQRQGEYLRQLANRLSSTLPHSATPITPLNHHFYAICLVVSIHLLDFEDARADGYRGLQCLRDAVGRHADLVAEDEQCWDVTILTIIDRYLTSVCEPIGYSLLSRVRRQGYLLAISSLLS